MQDQTKEISFLYDQDLVQYLKLHGLEYIVKDEKVFIPFISEKYLWIIAQNFGRYVTIKEVRRDFEHKYKN